LFAASLLVWLFTAMHAKADWVRRLEPSTDPIHVRVLFEENPQTEAVVSWTTTAEGESHKLYICTEPREGRKEQYSRSLPATHSAPYTLRADEREAGMHSWGHHVYLDNLEPGKFYYIMVESDGNVSEEYHFATAPAGDQPVRALVVSDSRAPHRGRPHPENSRRRVNALMRELFEEHPNIVAMMHGADYTGHAYWSQLYWWLKDHTEMTTTSNNRLLPIIPARGNHDLDVGFEEMFWWPDRENDYYYTTHLNNFTSLITLNTEISRGGHQQEWLESQLRELRPQKRWLMAMYHRPAYPSVRGFGGAKPQRAAWVPLYEKYGLDAAYESHDHALKRTYPIYDGKVDHERGIIYFGDGGGGVKQRRPDPDRWYLEVTGRYHHVHLITFDPSEMDVKAIEFHGNTVDHFTLQHDRRGVGRAGQ
jgi:hypothetical protein